MATQALSRARERLLAADAEGAPIGTVCEQIVRAFHDICFFDRCAVMTTDPETMLPAGGFVEGFVAADCGPFWDTELLDPDFDKFSEMARRFDHVATLADSVDGDLRRSPRYQKLYCHVDASDELRVVFVSGTTCLAVGAFLRSDGKVYSPEEQADARQLLQVATAVLRRALGRVHYDATKRPPVVIVLDGRGEPIGMTPGAEQVLADLRTEIDDTNLPGVILVAAAKARWSRATTSFTTRVRGRSGRWLRVHVAPMDGQVGEVGATVLTVETARPDDLVPILLDSYGLTERETEVVLLLCRGLSLKEIASELIISPHTVRDHVKAIHEKADVSTRGELVAKLFCNHVLGRLDATVAHSEEPLA